MQPARVISVTSGKGGVGKTNTSVNLGLTLARLGRRVLVLDADLGLANIHVVLGVQPRATINEVMNGKAALKDVVVTYAPNFDIIPASSGVSDMTELSEGERMALVAALDEFGAGYDYLIVDTAAGIGANVLYFNVAAEEILVVVDHEPTSITDAYALIKVLATEHGVKNFSVLVNRVPRGHDGRSTYAQLAAATDKFLKSLSVGLSFMGGIGEDDSVTEAVILQKPFVEIYPSARASQDMLKLAKRLESEKRPRPNAGGMQFFFKALVESRG